MSASNNKASSLKWAIEELSKQRDDLDAKLKVAHKRDETNALIDEVFAQKKALELRISALEDGLRVSTELVETTSSDWNLKCPRLMKNWILPKRGFK